MREPRFDICWQRQLHPEDGQLQCRGLTYRQVVRRMVGAIRNSGPVVVLSLERHKEACRSCGDPEPIREMRPIQCCSCGYTSPNTVVGWGRHVCACCYSMLKSVTKKPLPDDFWSEDRRPPSAGESAARLRMQHQQELRLLGHLWSLSL